MKRYILLAEICFDWSAGEYGTEHVNNVYLGYGNFKDKERAKERADEILKEYCEMTYGACEWKSSTHVKEIDPDL